jgi:biotin synthase
MRCQKSSKLLQTGVRALGKPQPMTRKYGTVSSISPQVTAPQSSVFENALAADTPRNTWTKEEIKEIYDTPLMKLAFAAVRSLPNFQLPIGVLLT